MAFAFRLHQLLQIAVHEENETKKLLDKKDGEIAELEVKIQKYKEEQAEAFVNQQKDLLEGNLEKAQMYPAYIKSLKKSEDFYTNEKELCKEQRSKIFLELQEKQRKRKTFEKMQEIEETKYKKEMLKKQQKLLDEFGSRKRIISMEP